MTFIDSQNAFTQRALQTDAGKWCFNFSRFPHVTSEAIGDTTFVRVYDMQFSFDERLAERLGFGKLRQIPFGMTFNYAPDTTWRYIRFNGKLIEKQKS